MSKIDDIEAAVANQRTVIDSAIALLATLHQELSEALEDDDQDRLQAVVDGLEANRNALAQAITANTPVAGSPGEGTVPTPANPTPEPEPDAPEGDEA